MMSGHEDTGASGADDSGADGADELGRLAAEAAALDVEPLPPGAPDPAMVEAQQAADMVRMIGGALRGARALAAPRFDWWADFRDVWSDRQLDAIAAASEELRAHMGWEVGDMASRFGPWIGLAVAAGMPAYVTWQAMQDERERRAQALRDQAQARPAGG
ncbi:MAG: hypothetical protein RIQ53_3085 [Pseudomonadota bacterium]